MSKLKHDLIRYLGGTPKKDFDALLVHCLVAQYEVKMLKKQIARLRERLPPIEPIPPKPFKVL